MQRLAQIDFLGIHNGCCVVSAVLLDQKRGRGRGRGRDNGCCVVSAVFLDQKRGRGRGGEGRRSESCRALMWFNFIPEVVQRLLEQEFEESWRLGV